MLTPRHTAEPDSGSASAPAPARPIPAPPAPVRKGTVRGATRSSVAARKKQARGVQMAERLSAKAVQNAARKERRKRAKE